jgi:hypothetical protein
MREGLGGAARRSEFNWGEESSGDRPDVIMPEYPDYRVQTKAGAGRAEAANVDTQTDNITRTAEQRNIETDPAVLARLLGDFDADFAEAPRATNYIAPQDPAEATSAQKRVAGQIYMDNREENLSRVRIPSAGNKFTTPGAPGLHGEAPGDIKAAGLYKERTNTNPKGETWVNMGYNDAFRKKPAEKGFFRRVLGL